MSNIYTNLTDQPNSIFRTFGRSPMQWNDELSAGFSNTTDTWLPVAEDYKTLNVKVERGVPRSSLNIYKGMQKLRKTKAFKAFKEAGAFIYGAVSENVFLIVR